MLINLTPHALNIEGLDPIPPSGQVARVTTTHRDIGTREGVRLRMQVRGLVEGLPPPQEGITYIVSGMVLEALAGTRRADVVAPDTGPDAIRHNGQIVAVRGFVC